MRYNRAFKPEVKLYSLFLFLQNGGLANKLIETTECVLVVRSNV